jgi:MFS family permease
MQNSFGVAGSHRHHRDSATFTKQQTRMTISLEDRPWGHDETVADKRLGAEQLKILALASLGSILEFLEYNVFIFLSPIIGALFFPPDIPPTIRTIQVMSVFAIGYLGRPIGGVLLGLLGDRFGRKKAFGLSILLIAAATLSIGLLPTFATVGAWAPVLLLLCRLLQGFSLGGELPGALIFAGESVPQKRFGFIAGVLTGTFSLGSLLGALTVIALENSISRQDLESYGWRLPFLLAGIFGLVSYYLRRYTRETEVFRELERRGALSRELTLRVIFQRYKMRAVYCVLIALIIGIITNSTVLYPLSYFVGQIHMDIKTVHAAQFVSLVANGLGCVIVGFASVRFGMVRIAALSTMALAAAMLWFYHGIPNGPELALRWGLVQFFCAPLTILPLYIIPQMFPPQTRLTGFALTFGFGLVLSSVTPVVLPIIGQYSPYLLSAYPVVFATVSVVSAFLASAHLRPLEDTRETV